MKNQYNRGGNSFSWIVFMDQVCVVSSHEYSAI